MTLLFLLIAAAGGVVVLVYEKRLREENIAKLSAYAAKVAGDEALDDREKMTRLIDLFTQNRYRIETAEGKTLIVSRREFSVGAALIWLALGGVGLIAYLVYYFLKKPETLRVYLDTGQIYAE